MCDTSTYVITNASGTARVVTTQPQRPILQRKDVVSSLTWLVPLGMQHLEALWDDETTNERILNAVSDFISLVSQNDPGVEDLTPMQMLLALDIARK